MRISEVRLVSFRNYDHLRVTFAGNLHIFVGANAQGKTNLLESLYIIATGRSYRTPREIDLLKWDADEARLEATVEREVSSVTLRIDLQRQGPKKIRMNGKQIRRQSDLFGYVNAVIFSPDDLQLIKGSPSERRRFLDFELSQVSPAYRYHLSRYQKVIRQRNQTLRDIRERRVPADMLSAWDAVFIDSGAEIMARRARALRRMTVFSQEIQAKVTQGKEQLSLLYAPFYAEPDLVTLTPNPTWEDFEYQASRLEQALISGREEELQRGTTLVGPQRDDFIFAIDDMDLKHFGSQGQQRTAVLALKLSEIAFMHQETGIPPVLLLDDVMSELDESRRHFLLETVTHRTQTFITTTELSHFSPEIVNAAETFSIVAGEVQSLSR